MAENICVFCDRSQFEERLCGETKDFWIIATLGQIVQGGYILLVPKRHVECIGALEKDEIDRLCQAKQRIYEKLGYFNEASSVTIFEHGIAGQSIKHAHLHIVPVACRFSDKVAGDFLWNDMELMPVLQQSWHRLREKYAKTKEPYLLWKDSGIGIKVLWNPQNTPAQYFRNLLFEEIGQPELANWRKANPEEDKKRWQETVKMLKPHFSK